jgi:hypothetical protein
MQKHRQSKLIRNHKNEINKILHYGRLLNLVNRRGNQNGVKEGQDGILNVRQWPHKYLGRS